MKNLYTVFVRLGEATRYFEYCDLAENEEKALEWAKNHFTEAKNIIVCEVKASWNKEINE